MAVAERLLQDFNLEYRSDKSLVRAAQSGRSDAYEALVNRYYPKVFSFVSHLLSTYRHRASAPGAEDLTQEVFARALNALSRFNGDYRFGPWLLRIARNLCVDETRRDSHRAEPADPIELPNMESIDSVQDDVWESVSKSEVVDVVRKALARLPMRQRTVLILRELEGWSYSDIAPVVGTNIRGVEATLRRARARFRLEASNFETDENERAICRRVTHLAAADPNRLTETELSHIDRCDKCRLRTARIRKAEKILGLMPALGPGSGFSFRTLFEPFRMGRSSKRSRLGESMRDLLFTRDGIRSIIVSPVAQVLETAAALVVAASIAVSAAPASRAPSVSATDLAVAIVSPEFETQPEAALISSVRAETSSSSEAVASSSQRSSASVDFASEGLIAKALPIAVTSVVKSASASVIAVNLDDLDSWEATDTIFAEVGEIVVDLGVTEVDPQIDEAGVLDAAVAEVSVGDVTSSIDSTGIAPRHRHLI